MNQDEIREKTIKELKEFNLKVLIHLADALSESLSLHNQLTGEVNKDMLDKWKLVEEAIGQKELPEK